MPVTPTYPGIYIQELPSSARTITAAPTSITVFVGYTHPFKTKNPGQAVRIFNFTEYEREFGGFFASNSIDPNLPHAVNQFFLNGGSDAYVVGLQPHYYDSSTNPPTDKGEIKQAILQVDGPAGLTFTAREPIDQIPMKITINNRQKTKANNDTADIVITYGSQSETFRQVNLNKDDASNYIDNRINEDSSSLILVAPTNKATKAYPTSFQKDINQEPLGYPVSVFGANYGIGWTTFNPQDFVPVFLQDSSLDKVSIFNLLVLPGIADITTIWPVALAFCERKYAFLILDPPPQAVADLNSVPKGAKPEDFLMEKLIENIPKSKNGAIYFPYVRSINPLTGKRLNLPPSGYVAGIYARTDLNRGVWKAPAGLETTILTTGVVEEGRMNDQRQGILNPIAVNCLRSFPGSGTVVYGARTLVGNDQNTAFQQWKYVPVRRMALFLEQTLLRNLGWVVFEPNDEPLWIAIRTSIENFMLSLFNQGAFQGSKPSQAFQVKCDASTTTQTDIDNGIVNIIVAFAPLKPAEFVIVKIAQLAGQVQS
jgi:phage tail sheath protein FI